MPLSIQFGNVAAIELSGSGDLAKKLAPALEALFQLDRALANAAEDTLGRSPSAVLETPFKTDREANWTLDGANVCLSFKPSATGVLKIVKSGELFDSITVPPGKVYIAITLRVSLAVSGGATYSAGSWGVKANIGENEEFEVSNYKRFDASERLGTAVVAAFENFVLPFKADGVERLRDGDYIDFEMLGKLNLGFGVTYGFDALKLAGRSAGEVKASFVNNRLGQAVLCAQPAFQVGAEFSVAYDDEDTFRVTVGAAGKGISLSLRRIRQRRVTTGFKAGITMCGDAQFDASDHIEKVLGAASTALTANLQDDVKEASASAIHTALKQAAVNASNFVDEINQKVNNLKAGLAAQQEKTHIDTVLFRLDFDCNQPAALVEGFELAMQGRYCDAIRTQGVSLAPDSYVESQFISCSSLTLEFFDLWKFTDATTYTRQLDAIYAGAGVFRLRAKTGVKTESGEVGRTGQCEVYFTAEARERNGAESVEDLTVKLNFSLSEKSTGQMSRALDLLRVPAPAGHVARVTCVFGEDSYRRLQFDPPQSRPAPNDRRNYEAFAAAVQAFDGNAPGLFASYPNWAILNVTRRDRDGSTRPPDRTQRGGPGWPSGFPAADDLARARIGCYFEAGRHFMNLCASLRRLSDDIDAAATEAQYNALLDELTGIIRQDAPVLFLKPALAALLRASASVPANAKLSGTELVFEAR